MACGWQNSCRPWSCNYLQNAGATTYKNFLQFYAKKACKKHAPTQSGEILDDFLKYLNSPENQKKYQHFTYLEKELLYYFNKLAEIDKKEIIEFTKIKARKQK